MYECSCLCRSVRFEIKANLNHAINCHCKSCRKSNGSQFVTVLVVLPDNLKFITGENKVKRFPVDESKTGRYVCEECGSKLFAEMAKGLPYSVYTSSLENEEEVQVMAHTNVGSKSPVCKINDNIPQFEGQISRDEYISLVSKT